MKKKRNRYVEDRKLIEIIKFNFFILVSVRVGCWSMVANSTNSPIDREVGPIQCGNSIVDSNDEMQFSSEKEPFSMQQHLFSMWTKNCNWGKKTISFPSKILDVPQTTSFLKPYFQAVIIVLFFASPFSSHLAFKPCLNY